MSSCRLVSCHSTTPRRAAAPVQAVLGSAGLLVAGAALGGIMLGLLIAKAASDFFNRKEFAQSKALSENAVLRAKVGLGRDGMRLAGRVRCMRVVCMVGAAGQVCNQQWRRQKPLCCCFCRWMSCSRW